MSAYPNRLGASALQIEGIIPAAWAAGQVCVMTLEVARAALIALGKVDGAPPTRPPELCTFHSIRNGSFVVDATELHLGVSADYMIKGPAAEGVHVIISYRTTGLAVSVWTGTVFTPVEVRLSYDYTHKRAVGISLMPLSTCEFTSESEQPMLGHAANSASRVRELRLVSAHYRNDAETLITVATIGAVRKSLCDIREPNGDIGSAVTYGVTLFVCSRIEVGLVEIRRTRLDQTMSDDLVHTLVAPDPRNQNQLAVIIVGVGRTLDLTSYYVVMTNRGRCEFRQALCARYTDIVGTSGPAKRNRLAELVNAAARMRGQPSDALAVHYPARAPRAAPPAPPAPPAGALQLQ